MGFSEFLDSRRGPARELVERLRERFDYVSILGADVKARTVQVTRETSSIAAGPDTECGFVVKMVRDGLFYEYSLDDIAGDPDVLAQTIDQGFQLAAPLQPRSSAPIYLRDPALKKDFVRPHDLGRYTDQQLLDFCKIQCASLLQRDQTHLLNAVVSISSVETSKLFVSPNRELSQNYAWVNGVMAVVYRENDKVIQTYELSDHPRYAPVLQQLPTFPEGLLHKAHMLTLAKPIVPGVYDVITDPTISGLIAHEAFGHGVEMDQFVKDRALARQYMGKYVASPICNMRDGAEATISAASYFFDDDGVLAGNTQIIRNGVLVAGLSDLASATELGTTPTGNGRRQSTRRKAYARMTNTFFEPGEDRLEDMIASIDHGYMLFDTDNGMEDPKNWAIQCVAQYGIEIVDGKLTDNYVSPVVMSGYVPDLLQSISMVSGKLRIIGAGMCGKGYKEWVRVSDGGPALKVRVKLG